MQPNVRSAGIVLIKVVALALMAGTGCGGEPNDEGIKDMESVVAPDAPGSMEEYYQQQQQQQKGGATKPSS